MIPPTYDPHTKRRDRAAYQINEQAIRAAKLALPADEHGDDHHRDHADPLVEERAQDHGGDRNGNQLRMNRPGMADNCRANQDDHRRAREHQQPANVAIHGGPENQNR